jgi:hypothetical protein
MNLDFRWSLTHLKGERGQGCHTVWAQQVRSARQRGANRLCQTGSPTLCSRSAEREQGWPRWAFGRQACEGVAHEYPAELVGISRETTIQVLNELHSHGLIALRRGTIARSNRAALRMFAKTHLKLTARVILRLLHADYHTELRTCRGLLHVFVLPFQLARMRQVMFDKVLQFLGELSADSTHEKLHILSPHRYAI